MLNFGCFTSTETWIGNPKAAGSNPVGEQLFSLLAKNCILLQVKYRWWNIIISFTSFLYGIIETSEFRDRIKEMKLRIIENRERESSIRKKHWYYLSLNWILVCLISSIKFKQKRCL